MSPCHKTTRQHNQRPKYRREASQGGMVDLKLVQQRLAGMIDQEIASRISAGPKRLFRFALVSSVILSLGACAGYRLMASPAAHRFSRDTP